jgi:site-specific DNA recombinase
MVRHRRGKRHAARAGSVNVLGGAPSGSRYSNQHQGGGQARDAGIAEEARGVRQGFEWRGCQRLSRGAVCRRLLPAGDRPRTGRTGWDRRVVWERLNKPADRGSAACGKPRQGPLRPRLRAQRGQPLHPRQATSTLTFHVRTGLPSPCPCWSLRRSVQRGRRRGKKTAGMRGRHAVGPGMCFRVCCSVTTAALPATANR